MGQSKTPSDAWAVVERQPRTPATLEPACSLAAWHGRCVFPNARHPHRNRPMSESVRGVTALDIPLERMTLHGYRAMARTILVDVLGFRPISSSTSWPTWSGIPTDGPTTGRRSCPNVAADGNGRTIRSGSGRARSFTSACPRREAFDSHRCPGDSLDGVLGVLSRTLRVYQLAVIRAVGSRGTPSSREGQHT